MKKKILIGSIIAVVILILASFSSVVGNVSYETELVEIDVELCGLNKEHKVKLTQEEANQVKLLFDEIRHQLGNAETRAEAVSVFNWAIEELDKYDILGDLSKEQAQALVTGEFISSDMNKIYERFQSSSSALGDNVNALCLLSGRTNGSFFYGPINRLLNGIGMFILIAGAWLGYTLLLSFLLSFFHMFYPLPIGSTIAYGAFPGFGGDPVPADGWVTTSGLNGNKSWETPMYGWLLRIPLFLYLGMPYPGVTGFTGIKLQDNLESFYLGFALLVRIGPKPLYPIW